MKSIIAAAIIAFSATPSLADEFSCDIPEKLIHTFFELEATMPGFDATTFVSQAMKPTVENVGDRLHAIKIAQISEDYSRDEGRAVKEAVAYCAEWVHIGR